MTLLHEAVDQKKFDVRVIERNIARERVRPEDLEKVVKALPDDASNSTWVNLDELARSEDSGDSRS